MSATKNIPRFILPILLIVVLLASCTAAPAPQAQPTDLPDQPAVVPPTAAEVTQEPAAESPSGFNVTDSLGREVYFEQVPQRIVQAGKSAFMLIDAAYLFPQASERLVAMTKAAQAAGAFGTVADPGYDQKVILENDVSAEQVAALQPDVVILKSFLQESLGKPLEDLGIPVLYLDFETPDQYSRDLKTLGQLFQDSDRADALVSYFENQSAQVSEPLKDLAEDQKPSVLVLYYTNTDGQAAFNVPPLGWMQTILVETAGGNPIWKDAELGKGWSKVNFEQIAAWNPDQVFLVSYFSDPDEVAAALKTDPQWETLAAVKNGQLYAFPGDFYSWDQPDVRWVLGLNWLASKIHPEVFTEYDAVQSARDFYRELYGVEDGDFDEKIMPLLHGDLK